ncbi:MAG: Eco47II family restriction endonuclease [Patescibacteria group bacterium]
MPYLKFISDKDLIAAVDRVVKIIKTAEQNSAINLHKNVIDPFSALFDGVSHSITYKQWLAQEKVRQIQKTMQNAIGDFHQCILGSIPGWTNLGVGGGLDVMNKKMKIIAEIKNKHNTTKGDHAVKLYDSIESKLNADEYKNFTGYYVEIIPKGRKQYDKPYTPSDNNKKEKRPLNERIRVIDGISFYAMATGRESAMQELFEAIQRILEDKYKHKLGRSEAGQYFDLFSRAFPIK